MHKLRVHINVNIIPTHSNDMHIYFETWCILINYWWLADCRILCEFQNVKNAKLALFLSKPNYDLFMLTTHLYVLSTSDSQFTIHRFSYIFSIYIWLCLREIFSNYHNFNDPILYWLETFIFIFTQTIVIEVLCSIFKCLDTQRDKKPVDAAIIKVHEKISLSKLWHEKVTTCFLYLFI